MATIITRTWSSRGPLGRRVRHVSYGYDVRINGQRERRWSADWTTETQAHEALTARLKEAESGRVAPPADRTLGALAEAYLRYKADTGKRSLKEDRRILARQLLPAFGADRPVRALNETLIAQYEQRRRGQVSACTVSNELSVLRHMLRLGMRWGYLDRTPDIEMPKKPEGRLRYLDEDEIGKLLGACARSRNPYLAPIVTLALNTGTRKAEILGLTWERVELAADYGLSARLTLYRTKSGKPRGVPLNADAIAALAEVETDEARRQGPVFKRRDGTTWGQIRTAFTTALTRAGIAGFRFHDLRHTFASHFMMRGGNLYDLKEILGHSDITMTMRYAHLSPQHLRAGMERLEGLARVPAGRGWAHKWAQNDRMEPQAKATVSQVRDSLGTPP